MLSFQFPFRGKKYFLHLIIIFTVGINLETGKAYYQVLPLIERRNNEAMLLQKYIFNFTLFFTCQRLIIIQEACMGVF